MGFLYRYSIQRRFQSKRGLLNPKGVLIQIGFQSKGGFSPKGVSVQTGITESKKGFSPNRDN